MRKIILLNVSIYLSIGRLPGYSKTVIAYFVMDEVNNKRNLL